MNNKFVVCLDGECQVKYNFVETARKFIAKRSIRKPGSSSVLTINFAIINLRGVSTKLYFNFKVNVLH